MADEEEDNDIVTGKEDEEQLVKKFTKMFLDAENERQIYDKRWDRDREIARGIIDDQPIPSSQSDTHINDIHAIIQRQVAILTDSRPAYVVTGRSPEDDALADVMKALVMDVLDRNDLLYRLPVVTTDKLAIGTGIWKVIWDNPEGSIGDVRYEIVNPKLLYPAPEATCVEDARYIIEIMPMTVEAIRERWPDKWEDIKEKTTLGIQRERNEPKDSQTASVSKTLYQVKTSEGKTRDLTNSSFNATPLGDGDLYKVMEVWYRLDGKRGKGKRAYVCADVLIENKDAPYNKFSDAKCNDEWPYAVDLNVVVPHEFWGEGDVEQLESPQWAKTRVVRRVMDWINHIVTPQVVVDKSTGLEADKITNKPGAIFSVRQGTLGGVRWREVPPIPDGMFALLGAMTNSMETISGVTDVTQGQKPGSVVAATAIARLQEAAYTLMRLKARNTEAAMKRVGELTIARIQQFYKMPRVVRVVGEGLVNETYQLNQPFPLGQNDSNGIPIMGAIDPTMGRFDLRVEQGSMLPVNKQARAELALELAKQMNPATGLPMYMRPTDVLKYAGFPDAKQLQDRLNQEAGVVNQLKAQIMQMQQQVGQLQKELQIQAGEGIAMSQKADAEIDRLKNNIESLEKELRVSEAVYGAEHSLEQRAMKTDHVLTKIESDAAAKFKASQRAAGPEAPKSGPRKNI